MNARKVLRTNTEKSREIRAARKFLEELSWLLSANSNLDFRAIRELLDAKDNDLANPDFKGYASKNPNIHFLIGVLPIIFADEKLFPSNEDLVEFSIDAMNLPISRWEKRSRYELIGLIVCETGKLADRRLEKLVQALSKIVSNDPNAQNLVRTRKVTRLNWNEVIQKLTGD